MCQFNVSMNNEFFYARIMFKTIIEYIDYRFLCLSRKEKNSVFCNKAVKFNKKYVFYKYWIITGNKKIE